MSMRHLRASAIALCGAALAAAIAACGGSAITTTHYTPLTAAGTPSSDPTTDASQAPVTVPAPATATGSAPPVRTAAPQAPPANLSGLTRQFVALRDQGGQALAAMRSQASSTDLGADRMVMARAATVFGSYASQLRALSFPASMRADQNALVQAVAQTQSVFVQGSQVTAWDQLTPILQSLSDDEDAQLTATNAVERDLSLPQSTPRP